MEKTILIGMNNQYSAKANRWGFILTGLLFLFNGVLNIYNNSLEPLGLILGIGIFFGGIYFTFYGMTAFSKYSRFAMKIKITNKIIEIKNKLFGSAMRLNWSDITSIKFGFYEIIFQIENTTEVFEINSNADVSKEVKRIIREQAELKNIEVIGG